MSRTTPRSTPVRPVTINWPEGTVDTRPRGQGFVAGDPAEIFK